MKNWKKILAVAVMICFAVTLVPVQAHADALTAAMIGNAILGVASALGITFTVTNGTPQDVTSYMEDEVVDYVNKKGGSLTDVFKGGVVVTAASKLLIAQDMYNTMTDFIDWLADKNGLNSNSTTISETAGGVKIDGLITDDNSGNTGGFYTVWTNGGGWGEKITTRDKKFDLYYGPTKLFTNGVTGTASYWSIADGWTIVKGNGSAYNFKWYFTNYQGTTFTNEQEVTITPAVSKIDWSKPDQWVKPQPLPEDKSMEQTYRGPGFAEPQDLPDFLSRIPEAIVDGTLDVVDTIVDAGGPPPSPSPSPSPSPPPSGPTIGIAEKIAIILGEIIGILYDTTGDTAQETIDQVADGIQEVTQTVTDAITETQISTSAQTQDAIQEQTQTITDTITQTETQTQTEIQDATQTITDTITDSQTDIKDAIKEQTDTMTDSMTDIKEKLEDITEVPDDFAPQKHPLPRGVFPFCIPFDLHDLIVALSASPQTPEIHVPFDLNLPLPGGGVLPFHYQFDLDLHDFDGLAAVLRTLEFVAFGVGLLFVTGKVIKW